MPHPGGTLLEHLIRVSRRLAEWDAPRHVEIAGLCHAFYGTDGFAPTLLDVASPTDRAVLTDLIGAETEALVYLYASCDRAVTYPRLRRRLTAPEQPVFRDRFTGTDHTPTTPDLGAFLDITAANELDVFAHNSDLATRYGPGLRRLLEPEPVRVLLSAPAWRAIEHTLKPG
jgi:hypothetical protein